jgi:hypothetical protein
MHTTTVAASSRPKTKHQRRNLAAPATGEPKFTSLLPFGEQALKRDCEIPSQPIGTKIAGDRAQ